MHKGIVRIPVLSERRCIAGKGGHSARTPKTICILILLMDSGHYYCIIEGARAQFWYNNVIKRKIEPEVAGISKKKKI